MVPRARRRFGSVGAEAFAFNTSQRRTDKAAVGLGAWPKCEAPRRLAAQASPILLRWRVSTCWPGPIRYAVPSRITPGSLHSAQALAVTRGLDVSLVVISSLESSRAARQPRAPARVNDLRAFDGLREALKRAATIEEVRICEVQAAAIYWNTWRAVPVRLRGRDLARMPAHWARYDSRASVLTGAPRAATIPVQGDESTTVCQQGLGSRAPRIGAARSRGMRALRETRSEASPSPLRRLPQARREHGLRAIERAREALRLQTLAENDRRADATTNRKRSEAIVEQRRRGREWKRENPNGAGHDRARFLREVVPKFDDVPLNAIARVTGLSLATCSRYRSSARVPHPRHWEELRALVMTHNT